MIAVLVVLRHHANIRRLLKGQEPKIGRRKDAATPGDGALTDMEVGPTPWAGARQGQVVVRAAVVGCFAGLPQPK